MFNEIYSINTVMIIITNIAALVTTRRVYKNRKLDSYGLFVTNLALSDLLVGSTMALALLVEFVRHKLLPQHTLLGEIHHFIKTCGVCLTVGVTVLNLNVFTIKRMKIIMDPYSQLKTSKGRILKTFFTTWFVTLSITLPYYAVMRTMLSEHNFLRYERSLLSLIGIVSLFLLCYCFRRIHKTLQERDESLTKIAANFTKKDEVTDHTEIIVEEKVSCSKMMKGLAKVKKSTCLAITTVTAFYVCWLPYIIFNICHMAGLLDNFESLGIVRRYVVLIAQMDSFINPVIYIVSSYSTLKRKLSRESKRRKSDTTSLFE